MSTATALPDALADRLVFGFTAVLLGAGRISARRFAAALSTVGAITTPNSKRSNAYAQVTLHLVSEEDNPAGDVRIDLHVRADGNDLLLGNRCSIHFNGLTMMRGVLGPAHCGPPSLDGKLNVLGNQHRASDLVRQQLQTLGEALEYVEEALRAAFGARWKPEKLWLKAAEACRDRATGDAISDVRIIQHATMCGTIDRRWDEYERAGAEERGGIPTLRFLTHAIGPEDKVYPKRVETRRQEVSCSTRRKVTKLTGEVTAPFNAEGLRRVTLHFLNQASKRLDTLERHVAAALSGEASINDLLTAMKVLVDRASGDRKRKGPASPEAANVAKTALAALLSVGMFDAGGLHARHAIRRDLDGMCGPEGLLEKHARRAIYYLKPRFARACGKMRLPCVDCEERTVPS
jgi:hypothetical protein